MIQGFIAGNLGRDAEIKNTSGGSLLSFSVAVTQRIKNEKITTWVRCAMFGKRGEALYPFLTKGSRVAVAGELTLHEYNGKTSLDLRVSEVTLLGGGKRAEPDDEPDQEKPGAQQSDDEIPF